MNGRGEGVRAAGIASVRLAIAAGLLMVLSTVAMADPQRVLVTLYVIEASGKTVSAPGVKVHVSRLDFDPVTKSDGTISFSMPPGRYTLTTVTGPRCRFDFTVPPDKRLDLQLVISAKSDTCTPVTEAASSASPASAGGTALADKPPQ